MASERRGSTGCTKADRDNLIMEEKNKFVRAGVDVGRRKQVQIFFESFWLFGFRYAQRGNKGEQPEGSL